MKYLGGNFEVIKLEGPWCNLSRLHIFVLCGTQSVIKNVPCLGRKETAEIGHRKVPPTVYRYSSPSQIRAVQSAEPEMSCLSSLENDNEEAKFVWPVCAKDCLASHHIPDVDCPVR